MSGEIEVDESYFGAKRVRGKRGRGVGRKTPVFLLRATRLVTASRRYAKMQSHEFIRSSTCSAKELLPIIKDFS